MIFLLLLATLLQVPAEKFYHGLAKTRDLPGFYPYVSYLDFRNLCDHVIDQSSDSFNPDVVQQGDLVYVNLWFIEWFQDHVHDKIRHPYILVTGDVGAFEPPLSIKKLLHDPKVAAWFSRNMALSYHPKLFQIPFGQDLTPFGTNYNDVLVDAQQKVPMAKKHLLYMSHYPRPFGDRDKIVTLFENEPYCYTKNRTGQTWQGTSRPEFYEDLMSSYFVISPIGLEADCVRTWEALAFDCIPIVEHSFLDPLYEDAPVVKVHEWTDINEEFLAKKYEEVKNLPRDKAFFDYWIPKVKEVQARVKNNDLAFSKLEATKFEPQDLADLKKILGKKSKTLFIKGALTGARPLQLTSFSDIYVRDAWLDEKTFKKFKHYGISKSLRKNRDKISILQSDRRFDSKLKDNKEAPVFLDLSYFRHSLRPDPDNFRHSLKKDLITLMKKRKKGALICGNMVHNEYVHEVLEKFSAETGQRLETRGNFWFFKKR